MKDPLTVAPGMDTPETPKQRGQHATPAPRPWVQPVFERVRLNEALSGFPYPRQDGRSLFSG